MLRRVGSHKHLLSINAISVQSAEGFNLRNRRTNTTETYLQRTQHLQRAPPNVHACPFYPFTRSCAKCMRQVHVLLAVAAERLRDAPDQLRVVHTACVRCSGRRRRPSGGPDGGTRSSAPASAPTHETFVKRLLLKLFWMLIQLHMLLGGNAGPDRPAGQNKSALWEKCCPRWSLAEFVPSEKVELQACKICAVCFFSSALTHCLALQNVKHRLCFVTSGEQQETDTRPAPQASTVGKVQVRAVALGRLLSPVAMHSSLSLSLSESTSHPASESMSIAQVGDGIGDGSGDDLRAANALEANA